MNSKNNKQGKKSINVNVNLTFRSFFMFYEPSPMTGKRVLPKILSIKLKKNLYS